MNSCLWSSSILRSIDVVAIYNSVTSRGVDLIVQSTRDKASSSCFMWFFLVDALIKILIDINRCITDPANQCLTDINRYYVSYTTYPVLVILNR